MYLHPNMAVAELGCEPRPVSALITGPCLGLTLAILLNIRVLGWYPHFKAALWISPKRHRRRHDLGRGPTSPCHWLQSSPELTRQLHHSSRQKLFQSISLLLPSAVGNMGALETGVIPHVVWGPRLSLISSCIAGVQPLLNQASKPSHESWSGAWALEGINPGYGGGPAWAAAPEGASMSP